MKKTTTLAAKKLLTAEELDALHDSGKDMSEYIDYSASRRPGLEAQRVNVDFPQWMVGRLDREAARRGITRQSLVKYWISERLDAPQLAEDPGQHGTKRR